MMYIYIYPWFQTHEEESNQHIQICITLLRAIPTVTFFLHSFWHLFWKYIYMAYTLWHSILAFLLTSCSDILFWDSIWHLFWHHIWRISSDIFSSILSGSFSDVLSGMSSGTLSGILSGICIWHLFSLALYLVYQMWLRSGGDHFDPEVAVRVWRGTLWSSSCSWGPASNTLILTCWSRPAGNTATSRSQLRPGGENSDLGLAARVRQGTLLRSAGNTLILTLLFGSRWGTVQSSSCSWGPAEEEGEAEEEQEEESVELT